MKTERFANRKAALWLLLSFILIAPQATPGSVLSQDEHQLLINTIRAANVLFGRERTGLVTTRGAKPQFSTLLNPDVPVINPTIAIPCIMRGFPTFADWQTRGKLINHKRHYHPNTGQDDLKGQVFRQDGSISYNAAGYASRDFHPLKELYELVMGLVTGVYKGEKLFDKENPNFTSTVRIRWTRAYQCLADALRLHKQTRVLNGNVGEALAQDLFRAFVFELGWCYERVAEMGFPLSPAEKFHIFDSDPRRIQRRAGEPNPADFMGPTMSKLAWPTLEGLKSDEWEYSYDLNALFLRDAKLAWTEISRTPYNLPPQTPHSWFTNYWYDINFKKRPDLAYALQQEWEKIMGEIYEPWANGPMDIEGFDRQFWPFPEDISEGDCDAQEADDLINGMLAIHARVLRGEQPQPKEVRYLFITAGCCSSNVCVVQ